MLLGQVGVDKNGVWHQLGVVKVNTGNFRYVYSRGLLTKGMFCDGSLLAVTLQSADSPDLLTNVHLIPYCILVCDYMQVPYIKAPEIEV